MDVRIKFGRHDGEIRDVAPEAAHAMLADGRAEMAYADQLPPLPVAEVIAGKKPAKKAAK